ncbi:hypothetical protein GUJ93_ZPchr0010g10306 [Zizania palustris]|uniref:Uncharacterized protein n=1 Tax=Zizania palustris TaxID=103762 RepID=A0A8J5WCU2_ZIZPA|nr:hypothetical protein GUJ93_ZPchr0010g10306 [Zizania palustris]
MLPPHIGGTTNPHGQHAAFVFNSSDMATCPDNREYDHQLMAVSFETQKALFCTEATKGRLVHVLVYDLHLLWSRRVCTMARCLRELSTAATTSFAFKLSPLTVTSITSSPILPLAHRKLRLLTCRITRVGSRCSGVGVFGRKGGLADLEGSSTEMQPT